MEIDPDPEIADHASLLRSIKRGDITGMSFSFQTMPQGDTWNQATTPPTREVLDMKVFEVSVVAMPAYEQTDVEVALRGRARALGKLRTVAELEARHGGEVGGLAAMSWEESLCTIPMRREHDRLFVADGLE